MPGVAGCAQKSPTPTNKGTPRPDALSTFDATTPATPLRRGAHGTVARPATHDEVTTQRPGKGTPLAHEIRGLLKEPFPEPGTKKLYIHSEADFRVKMGAYLSLCDQDQSPQDLNDFPSDMETQRSLVQQLVEAMTNLNADDKDARIPVGRIKKLSPFEFHLMAWALLLEIRDVQRGSVSIPRWGKDWGREECGSFYERFEMVKSVLYNRKTAVSSLFDYSFVKRLALDPTSELSRKKTNKALNWKRKLEHDEAKRLVTLRQAQSNPPQGPLAAQTQQGQGTGDTSLNIKAASIRQGRPGQRTEMPVSHSTYPNKQQKFREHAIAMGGAVFSPHMPHGASSTAHTSFNTGGNSFRAPTQTQLHPGRSSSTVELQYPSLSGMPNGE